MPRLCAVAVASVVLVVAGCGDDEAATTTTSAVASESTAPSGNGVTVDGAWARTSPMVSGAGAIYLTLTSADGDALVGASVTSAVAAKAELHQTKMAGDMGDMGGDMATTTAMAGEMTMVPVDRIELPAGEPVVLAPGGFHIMLLDLAAPLEVGSSVELTLDFEKAADQTVTVPVRQDAP